MMRSFFIEVTLHPRLQVAKTILIKLLLLCVILSALESTYALEVNEALGTSPQFSNSNYNKIDRKNEDVKSSNQKTFHFVNESKKKNGKYSQTKLKRQIPMPTVLKNNVMVPVNLERGQLLNFMFSNDSLWTNKPPTISSNPSKLELSSNLKSSPSSNSLVKGLNDLPLQDKSMAQDALLMTSQDVKKTKKNSAGVLERDKKKSIYITITTCLQPNPLSSSILTPPPQLQIYISQSQSNRFPGPARPDNPNPDPNQEIVKLVGGYALHTIEATSDVFFGVYATNDSNFVGIYSAQVAASIDAPYHYYEDGSESNLFIADSDTDSVLLYTDPFIHDGTNIILLKERVSSPLPFVIFVADFSVAKNIIGLENSYCGLEQNVNILTPNLFATGMESNVATSVTTLGKSNLPRQQFLIDKLKPGTKYTATLAIASHHYEGNFVGGGGTVFRSLNFSTLAADNCDLIHSLSFCDQVAYSVPSNIKKFPNTSSLAAFYDNSTQEIFKNFEKVLAQIPCEINSSGQYSLARTCDDCSKAYKTWLCAVNIPRCTDVLSHMPWLQPRAIDQAFPNGSHLSTALIQGQNTTADRFSRNVKIDEFVSPGPYKEVLPCQELCHSLVSSCPASLGFNCPRPGQVGFDTSYGQMPLGDTDSQGRKVNITCNFPGLFYFSTAYHWRPFLPIAHAVLVIATSVISMVMV